ncbi:MAG TPA: hypothetical protein ENK57_10960 [Polyangiaceae bacterium]|nr:hypothetical protein [Polyangiaceae bacterium]
MPSGRRRGNARPRRAIWWPWAGTPPGCGRFTRARSIEKKAEEEAAAKKKAEEEAKHGIEVGCEALVRAFLSDASAANKRSGYARPARSTTPSGR